MTLTHSAVESLSRLGRYQDIISDCGHDVARINNIASIEHRLVLADSLAKVGYLETARSIVTRILQSVAPDSVRPHCEAILGWIAREHGNVDEATQRLQSSARMFRENGNIAQGALSSIWVFRISSERQPPQTVDALLADVRTLVTRAGDPHLTALLHESVARQEAQAGNFDEARRHLRTAMALVAAHPNAWLEQLCLINAFCISVYDCDLRAAEEHLLRAGSLIEMTGAFEEVIRNNQGHLYLHLGRFAKAEDVLRRVSQSSHGQVLQSALDGLGRLYLASGRLEDCKRALDRLRELQNGSELITSFPFRSSLITRIRLLSREQKWREAAQMAERAVDAGTKVEDRCLIAAARFLQAHALADIGSDAAAARALCAACRFGVWSIREHQGTFMQLSANLVQREGYRALGSRLVNRAERIWRDHDNACAESEFRMSVASAGCDAFSKAQPDADKSAVLLNSLASAFDLAYSPRLVGAELVDVIEIMGCSTDVRVLEARLNEKDLTPTDLQCTLALGTHRGKKLSLVCRIPDNPIQASLLADILRLGHSVVALAKSREQERNRAALWPADSVDDPGGAVFVAEEMQALLRTAQRVAATNVPVLITGETGTGKEVLARTIHAYSNRAKATFLPFNCSSTPRDMFDSQLFGHRRGAFTGATENFQGVIRGAAGGTLFLDEIGDMGLEVQPKLLRFLESSEVHPIGETQPVRADVRVIAATNVELDTLLADGRFRQDLFYRLNIVRLHVPPLRERRVEIPALANHYLQKQAQECGKGDLRLAEETMEYLVLYRWPGNVRQLANEMRRMAALAEWGAVLMPEHLSPAIAASRRTIPPSQRLLDPTEVVVRLDQPMAAGVQHLERAMMQYALKKCGGHMEETAAMLGLSRKGLYLKRQRFGIEPPEAAPAAEVA
jgi:DNA-binding NtrC family response regulator/tetratricopeptide (TPR) repeat protein